MPINAINGTAFSAINAIDGIATSGLTAVNGQTFAGSSLNTGLVAFWKLADVNDSVGSANWTNNNVVTFGAGKIGNCAIFVPASSQYFSQASSAALQTGDISFSFGGWFQTAAFGGALDPQVIITKNGGSTDEYRVTLDTLSIRAKVGGSSECIVDNINVLGVDTWIFFVMVYDAVADTILLKVNDNAGLATTLGSVTGPTAGDSTVYMSRSEFGGFWYMNGKIDALGFWKKALSASEQTELYNGGTGKEYPF